MKLEKIALIALMAPAFAMLGACQSMHHEAMEHDTASGMAASSSTAMSDDNMSFADMDKNHDGSLTKDELSSSSMLYQHFSTADTDHDGKLSEAEVSKHRADMAASGGK